MGVLIRRAVPSDYDVIERLTIAAYGDHLGPDPEYEAELRDVAGRAA